MEFRILGSLEVVEGGRNVALGGSRERALLARLLLSPNRVVPAERLIDDLWDGRAPEAAIHTLRVYVSRLRKALGSLGGEDAVLLTRAPGYLARVDPGSLDTGRFDSLLAAGREQATRGDHQAAAASFAAALGLWRGPALADVADDFSFLRVEAARLEEARLGALEDRIEADLACGRHGRVLPEIEVLTQAHPLRERLWAHRMVALYRGGRQAEALRAYQDVRGLLRADFGIEPGPALGRIQAGILRHDAALEAPVQPRPALVLPLPMLLTDAGQAFVGREAELQRLQHSWERASAGGARLTLIAGEPGVGKTRLAAELAGRLHAARGTVVAGRCDEDLGGPYQPFVEALRHVMDHSSTEALTGCLGRYGGELVRLVPELEQKVPSLAAPLRSDSDTERYRLFDAVAGWLAAMSAHRPVLLVLDDLQWAAKPTLLLLRHVTRSVDPTRVLILGLYRDTELGRGHPLVDVLADLRRAGDVERFSLLGLDSTGVAALLEQEAGHVLAQDELVLAEAILAETEGNPFFVREVLRHLIDTGALQWRQRRGAPLPVEAIGILDGVRDIVARRLSRLSLPANRVLRAAAVAGAEFELSLVGAVEVLDEEELICALEEASEARLIIESPGPPGRYRFAHALVRHTIYHALSAARRTTLHRRVGEAIEAVHADAIDDHLPALAHHWGQAPVSPTATGRTVRYATRAGDRALAQLAHDEAATYYRQALDRLGPVASGEDASRLELLIALGEAQRRAADPASRGTLLEAVALAQAGGDADAMARAALANTRAAFWSSGGTFDAERAAALEAALETVGEASTAVRARLLATLGMELIWTSDRARRVRFSDESVQIARSLGDPATLAHVLMTRVWTITAPDTLAERLACTEELLALTDRLGDPLVRCIAHFLRARVTLESGDTQDGGEHLHRAETLAPELGQPTLDWMVAWVKVGHLFLADGIQAADQAAELALQTGQASDQSDARLIYLLQRSVSYFHQGRLAELEPELSEMRARLPAIPGFEVLVAAAHWQAGREDEARSCLRRLAAASFELPRDPLWLGFLSVAAEIACCLDDDESARLLYDLLRPYPAVLAVLAGVSTGCAAHYLGLLATTTGDFAAAEGHFAQAAGMHEKLQAPALMSRTWTEWAAMLRRRQHPGDAERSSALLAHAVEH